MVDHRCSALRSRSGMANTSASRPIKSRLARALPVST
jgi:hypothetical protein